jgi:adenylate cyclase
VSMTLRPTSDGAKKVWNQIRNKARTPLHKLISYGELISEEVSATGNEPIQQQIGRLLNLCEAAVAQTHENVNASESLDAASALSESLLQQYPGMHAVAQTLAELVASESSETMRKDVAIIVQTVNSLEGIFKGLALEPPNPGFSQGATASRTGQAPQSAKANQLIANVEYLGLLLVVDDDEGNRDVLSRRLLREGYEVMLAESGRQALRMLNRYSFDLALLDIMMPEMDGIEVLAELKRNPLLKQLPVIMITAVDDVESITRCIDSGADDYLQKPFNPVILRARIRALLERKRLQDEQKRQHQELEAVAEISRQQAERAQQLLLNILPGVVADELKEFGSVKPMYFEDVTIVFADIVGFTLSTEQLPADELVELLNQYFTACDRIVARYGLEKLKTIGDCYMFGGGLPVRNPSHPVDSVLAAIEMISALAELSSESNVDWKLRIGINTGPVIAGVVGIHKFAFDVWGDTVNFTSRVEACGAPGRINLSVNAFTRVKDFFACEKRERVRIKEGKEVDMYFVNGVATTLLNKPNLTSLAAFRTRYATFFRKELHSFPPAMFQP